ncbi:hypothetical protein C8J57DRAFT_1326392 [Mycena rebaudengoi]|nr:hypothetical protein C8J57DRAFT_1326392 [Mycena rebaudengoi]
MIFIRLFRSLLLPKIFLRVLAFMRTFVIPLPEIPSPRRLSVIPNSRTGGEESAVCILPLLWVRFNRVASLHQPQGLYAGGMV